MSAGVDEVRSVCERALALAGSGPLAAQVQAIQARLDGPLRVAVAGRVKAGKSTLLNALVGERLAPTDAGECTRVVTWYQEAIAYDVTAALTGGTTASLKFDRVDGALTVDLNGFSPDDIERIDVHWPSSALRQITLIDTPGLASLDDSNSLRTRDFLAFGEDRPSDADAVIYLMRHLHRRDTEFLGAFMDRSVSSSSPVNTVVVLSRADEIGAGRLDAMESSTRIADRYAHDPELSHLCSAVVPVAGLLAETGLTLREDEAAALRTLASTDAAVLDRMLLSVGTFLEPESSALTVELRRVLLDRFGLFGVRFAVDRMRRGAVTTATELAAALVEVSGLGPLRRLIADHFLPRAQVLKARSALGSLRGIAAALAATDPSGAASLAAEVERCEASTLDFAHLRVAHLVRSGEVALRDDESGEVDRLLASPDPAERLGAASGTASDQLVAATVGALERWRTRGADPLAGTALTEVCETMARTYASLYMELTR